MTTEVFRINIEGFEKAAENLSNLDTALKKTTAERNKLLKQQRDGNKLSDEEKNKLANLTAEQVRLSQEKRKFKQVVDAEVKLQRESIKTYNGLSASLAKNRREYKDLAAAGQENSKRAKTLLKQISEQDKKLKQIDGSVGQFQRNVGNYKGDIISAFQQMGVPVGGLNKLFMIQATAQQVLQTESVKTAGAMKILKVALISTGIGAIVVAVGALAAAFMSTQRGVDALNRVLIPIQVVFQRLWGVVQELSFAMVDAFSNPKQAISDLWEALKTNLLNRITAVVDQFSALGKVIRSALNLDWEGVKEGAKEFGESYIQMLTGVDDLTGKVAAGFKSLGNEISDARKEGERLAEIREQLQDIAIVIAKNEGRLNRIYQEQYTISQDVNRSNEERQRASEAAIKAQDELTALKLQELELQIEQAQLKAKQNDTDKETEREIAALISQRDQIQADATAKNRRLQNQLNTLKKQDLELQEKITAEINKSIEAAQKFIEEQEKSITADIDVETDSDIKAFEDKEQKKRDLLKQTQDWIKQYSTQTVFEQIDAERKALKAAFEANLITHEQYSEASKMLTKEETGYKIQSLMQLADVLQSGLREGSVAQRAIASAMTAVNTYQAIMKTYATLGYPWGIPAAAAVGIQGAMQIAKINNVKFAKGGVIGGSLHSQGGTQFVGSDGSAFEAERGELLAIVNRRDTAELAALSKINSKHGKPFFAAGGTFTPQAGNNAAQIAELSAMLQNQRVYVLENDITTTQRKVQVTNERADI